MSNRERIDRLQQSVDWLKAEFTNLQAEFTNFRNYIPEVEIYCEHHKQPEVHPGGWNDWKKYAQGITAAAYVRTSVQPMEIVVPFDMGQRWVVARWDLKKKRYEFIKCPYTEETS